MELRCCTGAILMSVLPLAERHGDRRFGDVLPRLRYDRCRVNPAHVYLRAGQPWNHIGGAPPAWVIELIAGPRP
jgi:hypothetical protein